MKILFGVFAYTMFMILGLSFEARAAESCKPLYLEAAQALDEDRASCGLDKHSGLTVCTIITNNDGKMDILVTGSTVNKAAVFFGW